MRSVHLTTERYLAINVPFVEGVAKYAGCVLAYKNEGAALLAFRTT
jgi:hypothetical protein